MPAGYRLVSYVGAQGLPQAGILAAERVIAASDILGPKFNSVIDILRAWDDTHPRSKAPPIPAWPHRA
jgi:hypothetical protein